MPQCMGNRLVLPLIVVFTFLMICLLHSVSAQECQLNCKTKNCTVEGICICDLPSKASLLAGNRTFLGGVFCDIESLMCDTTNSFWCESGGICHHEQGEKYYCECPIGFAGEHCNLAGEICGKNKFCYNGGICHVDNMNRGNCDCPLEYLGSNDCVLPTPTPAQLVSDLDFPELSADGVHESSDWWVALVVAVGVLFSVSIVAVVATLYQRSRQKTSGQLQVKLSQIRHLQAIERGVGFDDHDPFLSTKNVSVE